MKHIKVNASKSYDILIGPDLLKEAANLIRERFKACRMAIITDDTVNALYGMSLDGLEKMGFSLVKYSFPAGEASKNMSTLENILEFLAENKLTRSDMIVALGGGVVGDIAGFAAAVYLRGINYIQIPTTFLAAIDSSVGGKTAVDLRAGKNLAGAFWQPSLVICDSTVVEKLPEDIFLDGMAEGIKYGILADPDLFDRLGYANPRENLEDTIARCVTIKRDVVCGDEFDRGNRQLLNLGHTVAHAIEALSDLRISHGRAVAMGMVLISRAADKLGLSQEDCSGKIKDVILKAGLSVECPYSALELAEAALTDKKRSGGHITLVIPRKIGVCVLYEVRVEELENIFAAGL